MSGSVPVPRKGIGGKWEASVARCLAPLRKVRRVLLPGPSGGRWNPLLLPGAVQPRFCLSNLDR